MAKKSIQDKISEARQIIKELEKKEKLKNKKINDKIINIIGSTVMKTILKNNDVEELKKNINLCSSKDQEFIKNNISILGLSLEEKR